MTQDHLPGRNAECDRGLDVFPIANLQHVAAKRADEQAVRVAYPVRNQLRRIRRSAKTYRSLRN